MYLIASELGLPALEGKGASTPLLLSAKCDSLDSSTPPMRTVSSEKIEVISAEDTEMYSYRRLPSDSV